MLDIHGDRDEGEPRKLSEKEKRRRHCLHPSLEDEGCGVLLGGFILLMLIFIAVLVVNLT